MVFKSRVINDYIFTFNFPRRVGRSVVIFKFGRVILELAVSKGGN